MSKQGKILPWSWSSLEAYETCPRAFYEIRILKNYKEDQNKDYLLWGNAVHEAMEYRIRDLVPLPENMKQWEPIAKSLDKNPGTKLVEQETAITIDGQPTGYWDADCWNRGKDDLLVISESGTAAVNIDWKTGKIKRDTMQLALSSLRVFAKYPKIEKIHASFSWLAHNKWTHAVYVRDQVPQLLETFKDKTADLLWSEKNDAWPAKPSGLCKKSRKPGSSYGGCIVASCPHSEYYNK